MTTLVVAAILCPIPGIAQPSVDLEELVGGLTKPLAAISADDGSGRIFIVELGGLIRIWDGTTLASTPFLDLSAIVHTEGNTQGLLGLAFHPDYAVNGTFFVNYIYVPDVGHDRNRVERYTVSADPDVADAASASTVLEVEQSHPDHNGGNLTFGPDGYLYYSMGDGGGQAGRPNSQDLSVLLGKMLRLDVDSSGPGDCGLAADYAIPTDNPFVGTPSRCDETWAYGFRNPWRWSFDRLTGDLFIGDVGRADREEINFQPAASEGGENYEWACMEGSLPFLETCHGPGPRVPPILEYETGENCSITGGYVYRASYPLWRGTYVFGDFCSGRIWFAEKSGATWTARLWRDTDLRISSFGEDDDGELYVVDYDGSLHRFTVPIEDFADGFESGDTTRWSRAVPD